MFVNSANLRNLYVAFSKHFENGLGEAPSDWKQVATEVPSTTRENAYGWLGKLPQMREWVGDRVINGIATHDYAIVNKPYELTVGVDRDDIEDDNLGVYAPLFTEMGAAAGAHYDQLVFPLLNNGFTTACYDGQNFFDADHPVLDAAGKPQSVSNTGGGGGTPWFLLDVSRALRPFILQIRKKPQMVPKDRPEDDNVFNRKEFLYGVDGRHAVGYGFWQMAFGSKQDLTAANYAAARASMQGMKGDYGRPLGLRPSLLVVPPSLEAAALEILNAERNAAGATNVWRGTAKLLVTPWLA